MTNKDTLNIQRLRERIKLFFIESFNQQNMSLFKNVFHPVPNLHKLINAIDFIYKDNANVIKINERINELAANREFNCYPLNDICFELLNII